MHGKFNALGKRPLFLMNRKTEEMFARNALEWAQVPGGRQEYKLRYNLIGLPAPIWVDPNKEALEGLLAIRIERENESKEKKGEKRYRMRHKRPPK